MFAQNTLQSGKREFKHRKIVGYFSGHMSSENITQKPIITLDGVHLRISNTEKADISDGYCSLSKAMFCGVNPSKYSIQFKPLRFLFCYRNRRAIWSIRLPLRVVGIGTAVIVSRKPHLFRCETLLVVVEKHLIRRLSKQT